MKLNTRSVVVGVLALASIIAAAAVVIWPANIPSVSAQAGGPALRINPAPLTVRAGSSPVLFGVEYSTDGQNWSDVSGVASIGSPQDVAVVGYGIGLVRNAGSPHGGNLVEVYGERPGVAQIIATYAGLTTSVNLTVTPGGAPRGPRAATCVINSNPVTTTGGVVRLSYQVTERPTTITITADDAAAIPSGTPTVGAPDPARVDGQASGSIDSGPVTKNTVFTMAVGNSGIPRTCSVTVPFNASGVLQYQGMPLDFDNIITSPGRGVFNGGILATQKIFNGAFVGNHFVFRGTSCRGDMHSQPVGSGLWSVSEDGTRVQERQQCIDAGSEGNDLTSFSLGAEARIKSSDSSDLLFTRGRFGAKRSVYYGFSGDQVVIRSVSPIPGSEGEIPRAQPSISGGYAVYNINGDDHMHSPIVRLSDWENVGISPIESFFSLGGYLVGRAYTGSGSSLPRVYKMQNGQVTDVGELPGNVKIITSYTYDFSKSPVQLVIHDDGFQVSGQRTPPRLIWYKVGSSSLELVKEMTLSGDFLRLEGAGTSEGNHFGVWGDYLIWPRYGGVGVIVGKTTGSTLNKVQTITLPNGGAARVILTSPGGYVAIANEDAQGTPSAQNPDGRRNQVHLYKFGGVSTSTPPVPPNPFPPSTLSQIPGQSLTISTSSTPTTPPKILIRMANILSVSPTSFNISIFGHTYTVDASRAKTYNMNWVLIPLSSFSPGSYVNVWGTLDLQDSTLIHAINIRNPLPAGATLGPAQVAPFTAPAQTPAQTAATQNQLNTLQQALRALQLRLGQ